MTRHDPGAGDAPYSFAVLVADGDRALLAASGELDLCAAPDLEELLARALDDCRSVVHLDLSAVTFIDCSAVNVLLRAQHACTASGTELHLHGAPASTRRLLGLLGLDEVLALRPEVMPH